MLEEQFPQNGFLIKNKKKTKLDYNRVRCIVSR